MIILLSGALFFTGLFVTFKHVIKTRTNLKDADVALLSTRIVSSIHALLASSAGVLIVASCSDVMNDRHRLATDFVWFGAPYMAYDVYAMYQVHHLSEMGKGSEEEHTGHSLHPVSKFLHKNFLLVLHHTALLTIFMPVTLFLRRGLGDFFIGCFFITELSTPFVSAGKVLIQLGLQDSTLHKINGLMVLLTFFLCRILLFPFMYWVYGRNYNIPLYQVPFRLPWHCNLGNLCILAPQLYWFFLLCCKARRLYLRQMKARGNKAKTS